MNPSTTPLIIHSRRHNSHINIPTSHHYLLIDPSENAGTGVPSISTSSHAAINALFPTQRGLRWENKTSIVDIILPPHATIQLSFLATISRSGVYDLNRFKISASYSTSTTENSSSSNGVVTNTTTGGSTATMKVKFMSGNSLIEVTE